LNINNLIIKNCRNLSQIKGNNCNTIFQKIRIDDCFDLNNVDFLFECGKIKTLEIRNSQNLEIPDLTSMNRIPEIMLAENKFHLYKKQDEWKLVELPKKKKEK
jgi:hypothetical protein